MVALDAATSTPSSRPTTSGAPSPTSSTPSSSSAIGAAFARLRRRRADGGADPRSWSPATCGRRASELVDGLRRGRHGPGRRRRRPRPRLDRPALLRRRPPRRPRGHVHRLAQPGPVQRHQALPGRRPARSARTPACAEIKAATPTGLAGRRRPAGHRLEPRTTSSPPSPTTCTPSSTSTALRPLKVVADTANGMGGLVVPGGVRRPARSSSRCSTASSTARSRTTRPIRSSPRTCATCRPGCSRPAPTSASPSTATPTACSSSTSRAQPCPGSHHHGDRRRRACSTSTRARRSSTT